MDARTLHIQSTPDSGNLENTLLELLRLKSDETFAHSHRVSAIAEEWVHSMQTRSKWQSVNASEVVLGARFHDVGKIGVSNPVLNKEGPLNPVERELMNQHSRIGFELFSNVSGLRSVALGILHHHERWDGNGYPSGLRGNAIPLLAQIIGIVDAFDAMTTHRCYQRARSEGAALEEIRLNAGTQFCPELVEDFAQFLNARNT